ncbi:TlpA family protein disulfide reductase [Flavobacterium sp. ZB4P23]|uniref:TlpA family protein disulfide reductase n=1 Tax=Flavobacterium sp. ZB4P23 TaxID=2497484 RepID=UPI000F82B178|nr:TlpA disulfide reductase family protein [Flavobacterium sp. ZB4P23]RTY81031.1 TlpA family protein disulfide reductase [Flavobacterium sp. ZB4P23]
MKKVIYLLLILVLASFTTSKELIPISGKITNTASDTISIKGELFKKKIILKADGSFSENISIPHDGIYTLETGKNSMPIYLSKETNLMLLADDNVFNTSLKYKGKGSIENQYIIEKLKITSQISDEELYKLDEKEFLKKVNEIKTSIFALYNTTKFSSAYFKEKEVANINYLEQKHLLFYEKYHNFYAHLKEFYVSDEFPKFDEKIDLDNDADFIFSTEYQKLARLKFFTNIKFDGTEIDFIKAKIINIKALKSQNLKNFIIHNSIYDVNIDNANYEKIYQEYLFITNDPKLKESLTAIYHNILATQPHKASPKFNYENQKGGKTSLESLKGKYVYIDVWATWCGPCLKEAPFLEKVEKQYQDKNIVFISISVDNIKDRKKWSDLVNQKQLGGIQLLADMDFNSEFIKGYGIKEIPRFILIDPNGKIENSDAPKPSDTKLIDLFNELKI